MERRIRSLLVRATSDLSRVNYQALNSDGRTQYDTAKRFVSQAEEAIKARNFVFGANLADKASALAATLAAEAIEAKIRAAAKEGKFDAKVSPGGGLDALVARAQAAGVITASEAAAVIAARDLTAKVIRVDDFPQDLGLSEMQAPHRDGAAPAPAVMHKAAA